MAFVVQRMYCDGGNKAVFFIFCFSTIHGPCMTDARWFRKKLKRKYTVYESMFDVIDLW